MRGFFLFSFFNLLWFPFVFSLLPPDQITTMIRLSQLLNDTALWNINTESNPCTWTGVECDPTHFNVTRISLSGSSLSSSDFLPVVCQIESLQEIDFSNNRFSSMPDGFIRGCSGIDGLRLLNFSSNRLVGALPTFDGFVGLESLDLSFNLMNGSIGSQLKRLVSLKSLNLSFNSFTGPVPVEFGRYKNLEQLELSKNSFQGGIPIAILDYVNLTMIDLSENNLSGSLTDRIGELSKLEVLILSSNNLTGEIPKSLSNINTLARFAANKNNFAGRIPDGIASYVKNLDLSYNKLNGFIPSGALSTQNLQTLDLSYNSLSGPIPSNISLSLVRLRLGSNLLSGTIPVTIGALSNLKYLEMDNNSLTGFIPRELSFCKNLLLLNLAENNLTGSLPAELGSLSNLQVMKLQSNNLEGEIPLQITTLNNLSMLNISWNFLNGSIPATVSNLQKLVYLNLQGNNLSGSIPNTVSGMSCLLELQLGRNQLCNPIPRMPQSLQIALNLSSNRFDGQIPYNLRLDGLEVLDLSNNKFSGEIPVFLTQMRSLMQLTLSSNQLSGVIPSFMPWVILETRGNPNLKNSTASHVNPTSAKKRNISVSLAISIAVAALFSVGLTIVVSMLISRRYYKSNVLQLESREEEDLPFPLVIQSNLLTSNRIHKSNIDIAKAMESVSIPNVVLKTRFSTYYRAVMPSGSSYYVKKLNWSDKLFQLGSHGRFCQELEVLGKLSNSNVMIPLAYVLTVDNGYLFYEFTPEGTLSDVLHGSSRSRLDWASRYSIAIGAAQGVSFLHGCISGPILLLDLSSRNIFLKSLKEPQIGDIELCKVIDPSKSTGSLSTVAGSVGYIPPEYAYTMRITAAGNVYSFGVILLELLTGKPAVSEGTELAKTVLSRTMKHQWGHILDYNLSRISPTDEHQMLAVLKVALACVRVSPDSRPKMNSVLRMLLNAR